MREEEFKTFTIITTRPNSFMSSIHDRMPVILEKEEEKPWLEENRRWVINEISPGSSTWRRENLVLNIAIGYPF